MTGAASFAQVTLNTNNIIGFGEFVEKTVYTLPAIAHSPAGTDQTQTEETHTYSFWTNDAGARYTVLEYTYDPGSDMVMEVTWQSGAPYLSVQEEGLPMAPVCLYPNPATDLITIDLNVEGKYDFEVIDGLERRALTGTIEGSTAPISVSELENGIYAIHLLNTSTNQVNVERFVVQ